MKKRKYLLDYYQNNNIYQSIVRDQYLIKMIDKINQSKSRAEILILTFQNFTFNIDDIECLIRRNFSIDVNGVLARHSK
jgi:hypothetical protein